jgi:very-short-patch-repair endonuclease
MDPNTQRRDWFLTLDAQSGVADRSQALQAGYSRRAMAHRLKSAKWRRVQRGVYVTFTGPVHREARLWAALRRAGPGAMLSHETAAEVHGLTDTSSAKIHVTVPADRHPARHRAIRGVVIHRSSQSQPMRLPEWKLPRTRIEDTVLDLVATARTFDEAYSWISRALAKKLVSADVLREALGRRSRIRWRVWLTEALADAEEGAYFPLERRYARDVERAHGLPKAQRQARRAIGGRTHYKDNWYPEFRVCVELDGPTYHQNEQIQQDKRRDNLNLAVDAAQTYRFGPVEVTERACESAAMVAATLRRRGWQGQPHPCRRPGCKVGTPR